MLGSLGRSVHVPELVRAAVPHLRAALTGDGLPCAVQLIMAFLVGVGTEEPLRFRLLPVDQFMNTGAYRARPDVITHGIECGGPGLYRIEA